TIINAPGEHRTNELLLGITAIAVSAQLLTAWGGTDDGEASAETDELQEVTVGVLSIATSVGVAYGIEHGIFEVHGFYVDYEVSTAGAEMMPAESAGLMDIGSGKTQLVIIQ